MGLVKRSAHTHFLKIAHNAPLVYFADEAVVLFSPDKRYTAIGHIGVSATVKCPLKAATSRMKVSMTPGHCLSGHSISILSVLVHPYQRLTYNTLALTVVHSMEKLYWQPQHQHQIRVKTRLRWIVISQSKTATFVS